MQDLGNKNLGRENLGKRILDAKNPGRKHLRKETAATFDHLLDEVYAHVRRSGVSLRAVLNAAGFRSSSHLSNQRHRRSLKIVDLLKILDVIETSPQQFFADTFPGEKGAPPQRRTTSADPIAAFVDRAGPPPRELAIADDGFDDPPPPRALAELAELEELRQVDPAAIGERCRTIVATLNLHISLKAAALWGSCLRLDANPRAAQAVVAGALRIARARHLRRAEADLIVVAAYITADLADSEAYHQAALLADQAFVRYLEIDDLAEAGKTATSRGIFLLRSGDPRAAVAAQTLALRLLPTDDKRSLAAVHQTLAAAKHQLGESGAHEHLEIAQYLVDKRDDAAKMMWQRAQMATQPGQAITCCQKAIEMLSHPIDQLLATIDLCRFYLQDERLPEALHHAEAALERAEPLALRSPLMAAATQHLAALVQRGFLSFRALATFRQSLLHDAEVRTLHNIDRPQLH